MPETPEKPKQDPIRPMDETARGLSRGLLRSARHAALATLSGDGHPFASLTSLATDADGTPLILVSTLSGHTANLLADPRASLLIAPGGKGDPLAHPRLSLRVRARRVEREGEDGARIRRRFLARQPKAALYVDFPDFSFFALAVEGASLNGGFGRAYEPAPADILSDAAAARALAAAEEGAVAHMNADHADAVRLYATVLLGAQDGAWRITGLDPDGLDLALGDAVLRLPFDAPVDGPGPLRATLVALAAKARAAA
ncbi:HugZ family protein [Bosea sp. (in: a-proteobacteria)]|jgi:putative heme iron utilization protein|uniref:HugZ family pyridoxamine 5'-phosphate oxidase n=1 Tax=Bosea sp. (in: a-proteobacteria) TaxID=1871050 RepID=UPI003F6EE8C2